MFIMPLKKEDITIEAKDLEIVMNEHMELEANIPPTHIPCEERKSEEERPYSVFRDKELRQDFWNWIKPVVILFGLLTGLWILVNLLKWI